MGSISLTVKKTLKCSFKKILPAVNLKVIFNTGSRMSSYFKYKDVFPSSLISGVVYKYKCSKCNLSYLGSTYRYFEKRLEEHLHISALTGKPLTGLQFWTPMDHARKCGINNTRDDFTIVCHEKNRYLVRLKESILIHSLGPELNNTTESTKLYLFA